MICVQHRLHVMWLCLVIAVVALGNANAQAGDDPSAPVSIPKTTATLGIQKKDVDSVMSLCQSEMDRLECKKRDLFDPEFPPRTVTVEAFRMDPMEVTNERYRACVASGNCTAVNQGACRIYDVDADNWKGKSLEAAYNKPNHPAICVTWVQAQTFCAWSGGRLPTEDEWEVAARGTDKRQFPWGNNWETNRANWGDFMMERDEMSIGAYDGYSTTAPVGSYDNASPYGLSDMAGNVWEWTASPFPGAKPDKDGNAQMVYRGGGFLSNPAYIRTSFRDYAGPNYSASHLGFRCAY